MANVKITHIEDTTTNITAGKRASMFGFDTTKDHVVYYKADGTTLRHIITADSSNNIVNVIGNTTVADAAYLGLGVAAGRIQFDDEGTDTVTIKDASLIVDENIGQIKKDVDNAEFEALQLINTNVPATSETGQAVALGFYSKKDIGGTPSDEVLASIVAGKDSDYYHATTEADCNGNLQLKVNIDGTLSRVLKINSSHYFTVGGTTDDADKYARFILEQYDSGTETEGFLWAYPAASSSANNLVLGGGSSSHNAATEINVYTAANVTTRTGTLRVTIKSDGKVGIGTTAPDARLHIFASTAGTVTAPSDTNLAMECSGANYFSFLNPRASYSGFVWHNENDTTYAMLRMTGDASYTKLHLWQNSASVYPFFVETYTDTLARCSINADIDRSFTLYVKADEGVYFKSKSTCAKATLKLEQEDTDKPFINFQGTVSDDASTHITTLGASGATHTAPSSNYWVHTHMVQLQIGGTAVGWVPLYGTA